MGCGETPGDSRVQSSPRAFLIRPVAFGGEGGMAWKPSRQPQRRHRKSSGAVFEGGEVGEGFHLGAEFLRGPAVQVGDRGLLPLGAQ